VKHPNTHASLLGMLTLLHGHWLTRREMRERTGLCQGTVREWVALLATKGFIEVRVRAGVFKGDAPREYTVTNAWRGR
jgi:DNA-binding FadR family transcriptional regulator